MKKVINKHKHMELCVKIYFGVPLFFRKPSWVLLVMDIPSHWSSDFSRGFTDALFPIASCLPTVVPVTSLAPEVILRHFPDMTWGNCFRSNPPSTVTVPEKGARTQDTQVFSLTSNQFGRCTLRCFRRSGVSLMNLPIPTSLVWHRRQWPVSLESWCWVARGRKLLQWFQAFSQTNIINYGKSPIFNG